MLRIMLTVQLFTFINTTFINTEKFSDYKMSGNHLLHKTIKNDGTHTDAHKVIQICIRPIREKNVHLTVKLK